MNLTGLDWAIVLALLATLFGGALYTTRYAKSVSTFLAAGRCGGRYLIAMAFAAAGTGVISLVYWFEIYYEAGYTAYWWSSLTEPALIVIALSGWIVYRFRQTRALTLAQFFEMRYSRNFRVFAGLIAFLSGIVNFGIYPAVGARFFIALCGLPSSFELLGATIPTFIVLMAGLLAISITFTFLGGQVAVMVTDFIQGAFANIVFIVLIGYLLGVVFRWDQIAEVLLQAPEGQSMIHPMRMSGQEDFNLSYFLIAVAIVFYTFNSWQGTSGYNASARSAHEAKMAGILYGWRFRVLLTVTIIVPLSVLTLQNHPDFAAQAAQLQQSLDSIDAPTAEQKATLQGQLRVPYALALLLPPGLLGMVVAAMLALFISTHDTYLHSWGSIFLQDVVLPFRKKPFTPEAHLRALRLAILGVAIFIFFFSIFVRPTQFIAMFFAITGAIFVGGAGATIIGGLYWKRGTVHGAWAAMVTGMVLSVTGVVVKQLDLSLLERLAASAPWLGVPALFIKNDLSGQELTFIAMCSAVVAYVVASLAGPKAAVDMDRLLHRGPYAVEGAGRIRPAGPRTWLERLGLDREFTRGDRWVTYVSIAWPLVWTVLFVGVTVWNLTTDVPDSWWIRFWQIWTWVFTGGAFAVTLWFTIGGVADLRYLFRHLKNYVPDPDDDGRVTERLSPPGLDRQGRSGSTDGVLPGRPRGGSRPQREFPMTIRAVSGDTRAAFRHALWVYVHACLGLGLVITAPWTLSGCARDLPDVEPFTPPAASPYLVPETPGNVLRNLVTAHRLRDFDEYAKLFDPDLFRFVFDPSVVRERGFPERWGWEDEARAMRHLFDSPEVRTVALDFLMSIRLDPEPGDQVRNPLWKKVETTENALAIEMVPEVPGESPRVDHYDFGGQAIFFFREILSETADGESHWAIVEWRDLTGGEQGESWGELKYTYLLE